MESQNQTTVSRAIPQVIYQPSGGPRGSSKLKLTEFLGDPLEWPDWVELFDVIMHQKRLSDIEKMQYLKISLTGQAKVAISGLGFRSQAYYQAWDILCKKFGRPRVIVESQLKKIYAHSPFRHDDTSSIVRSSNVFTNTVNVLTLLGLRHDLGSEGVLSSTIRKLSPQLKEQWLRHLQDHRLLAASLIVFNDWLESTAFIPEDLLAQTNHKIRNRKKPKTSTFASNADDSTKPRNSECPFKNGQHAIWNWEKFKSMTQNEGRELVQKFRLWFNCLGLGKSASDATTAVATTITQGELPVVSAKLVYGNHSLSVLSMCDTGSSIAFVHKSIVSTLQLQGRKMSLQVARIHGSQDVKTEIVPIAVSAHEIFWALTTVQFYVHEKLKLGNQILYLQGLKDRLPHLMNLPNQSCNLNEVQVILGQDCYDIYHALEFKKSDKKLHHEQWTRK